MISVKSLDAGYGRLQILFNVSMSARRGEITALLGPNGSGKSTLLKTIFGQASIYNGSIRLDGAELSGRPPHEIARLGIAYLPQINNLFLNLTVRENLLMSGYMLPEDERRKRTEEVLQLFPFLDKMLHRKASSLSGGERQMLSIGMALMRRPKVVMLDEPTANLSPKMVNTVLDVVRRLRDDHGFTVLLAEQSVVKALRLSDHAVLLVGGRVLFEGDPSELLNNRELGRMYLGLGGG
ncbi:High-affinity branched-chain amino acid transport ATP-binding protein LivF [Candidatus Calditenuaceae archaeon HR02]|nr:High-affinity branched-chain amino acid transport ATP-binding protein LivF [Candidatus Calditenuaceae archaeon HR02]